MQNVQQIGMENLKTRRNASDPQNRTDTNDGNDNSDSRVTFVTEDTVRSHPGTLHRLFTAAIEEGADGLCVCDTVGHATPNGVYNLIHFEQIFKFKARKTLSFKY